MALTTNKVSSGPILTNRTTLCKSNGEHYFPSSARINRVQFSKVRLEHRHQSNGFMFNERSTLFNDWFVNGKPVGLTSKTSPVSCKSTGANNTEEKECVTTFEHAEDGKNDRAHSVRGLAEAYRFACNDARFLSRGIMRMDARARQDVAFLGTEFLKLDARARKDTEKIDRGVKEKAKRLNRIATILKDIAESRLKSAADKHWSDGALEADLRLADFRAKQRAMEDALMSLELIKNIHDMMVSKTYDFPIFRDKGSLSENNVGGRIMLEKNGKTGSTQGEGGPPQQQSVAHSATDREGERAMPSFCPKCGDFVEEDACGKCGEKAVTTQENPWKAASKVPGGDVMSVPAVPTAFTAAARIKMMGVQPVPEPARKEQAVARFNFVPQDPSTQLALSKGDEVDVVRKDSDGWWFVIKEGEKGLVPGSYLHIENPIIPITDAAILAAREASNQRFMELQRSSGGSGQGAEAGVEYQSPLGLEALAIADSCAPKPPNGPARGADAKSGGTEFKPGEVRKLRKCYACKETILGRTKVCKDQIFHEICLLCKGCRESIEEDEDFTLIKKKAYHADCAKDVNHCIVCDKEILGRVYRAGDGAFHKLCMVCSVCNKQSKEAGAKLKDDLLVCGECVAEQERKEREEREAALERERAAAKAKAEKEAALAAARALEEEKQRKAREAQKAAEEAKAKAEAEAAAAARAQAEKEAAEAEAIQRAAAAAVANGHGRPGTDSLRSSTSNLDEFDLEATPIDMSGQNGRISEVSDIDSLLSDGDYAGYMGNGQRESLRLSEVLDLESYSDDRLSDLSGISEGTGGERNRPRRSTIERTVNENTEAYSEDDDDRELCGGCGLVLEGEAVGALNQYFHYECFKCSHCSRVIAEDDGYAEKDNQAFHQACYQSRFGKKCHRCDKVLKGKVVKALDHLYHPDCFVCYQCSSSLSESFFEHEGQAVCAKCKHAAIGVDEPSFPENMTPVSKGIAGYRFDAQDDTQLTIYPGDEVAILQKDDDGWWLVELRNKRGYVPGSYLIERPIEEVKPQPKKKKSAFKSKPKKTPGLCSSCSTQNPAEARFCRSCGNNLMA